MGTGVQKTNSGKIEKVSRVARVLGLNFRVGGFYKRGCQKLLTLECREGSTFS
jgi:hypothetical protein